MARYGTVMPVLQMLTAASLQPSAITADQPLRMSVYGSSQVKRRAGW